MNFTAIYDACVLYPAPIRDLLIEVAHADLIAAKWTVQIEDEWIGNLSINRPELAGSTLERTRWLMRKAIPDVLVGNYEALIPALNLPDPGDRHVLAAAIRCGAQVIVTTNLKDFPVGELSKYDIEPVHPDLFLVNQLDLSQGAVIASVKRIRDRLKKPAMSGSEYLEKLCEMGLPAFADRLTEYIDVI